MKLNYATDGNKTKHLLAGLVIAAGTCAAVLLAGRSGDIAAMTGLGAATLAAFLKEMQDVQYGGRVEVMDALATVAGGVLVALEARSLM